MPVAMEAVVEMERLRGTRVLTSQTIRNSFRKMVWKPVLLRLSTDTLEIRKACDPGLLLSRVHMAGIESCGLLTDMDDGFRVACIGGGVVLQLRCVDGARGSAHNWVRAIRRNAKEVRMPTAPPPRHPKRRPLVLRQALTCDAPYDARAAWDVVERS